MNNVSLINAIESFFCYPILPIITLCSLIVKSIMLYVIFKQKVSLPAPKRLLWLLTIILIGVIIEDVTWLIKLTQLHFFPSMDYRLVRFFIRIAWALFAARYLSFALFIEGIANTKIHVSIVQKIYTIIMLFPAIILCSSAFILINNPIPYPFETILIRTLPFISCFILVPTSVFSAIIYIRKHHKPKILKQQFNLLLKVLFLPDLIMELLQAMPFNADFTSITWVTNSYTFTAFSNILLTYIIFYCAKKLVGLRFLNIRKHVQGPIRFNFIDNFKDVLEQMGYATNLSELTHITQKLFQTAFEIPARTVTLQIRENSQSEFHNQGMTSLIAARTNLIIASPDTQLSRDILEAKILIYDEIEFSNFYEQDPRRQAFVQFLDDIYADIYIPIYNQQKIIGSIIIERNARTQLYNKIERDEMIIVASYLGHIINLLQSRNLEQLMAREKEMREELYNKHQEITQYKESMRSFIKNSACNKIGIIFYRNRQFIVGNREAKELIPINLNIHEGHPLTKAFKQLVNDVQQYKAAQTYLTHDGTNKLMIYALPHLDNNNVTLLAYYPDVSDLVAKQIDLLKDPSKWDYILYLETTETGKLINQLIPGSGEQFLNFKIELLQTALSTKATLLDMPSEDLMPTVELLHHINMRTQLHTMCLEKPQTTPELTIELFGINQLFGASAREPLLKKLDGVGSLFIENIHFLNRETQEMIAEFIKYGFFRRYKSDQKTESNVRIICSSNQPLAKLAHEDKFSGQLLKELQKTTLLMPSLVSLPDQEIEDLTQSFAQQSLSNKTFEKFLELNERDRKKITLCRPTSLQELKKRVQTLLNQKSKTNNLTHETMFDPAFQITDPELIEIARLGKHALKDEKTMALLWNKFQNQNKIATFLGVNRSSVNRRCKKYKLL